MSADSPGFIWLADHWNELTDYNFEWVAVIKTGLISHNADLDEVIRQVVRQGQQENAVYAFVDFMEIER